MMATATLHLDGKRKQARGCRHETEWTPSGKTLRNLAVAWDLIQAVPYQVSLRWLFYNMLQLGYYSKKSDYKGNFQYIITEARHRFHEGWRPDTLADDTRAPVERNGYYRDGADLLNNYAAGLTCDVDMWHTQDNYVEVWFEARAMASQFEYYAPKLITLRPLGGQTSLDMKWKAAQAIEEASEIYGLPVTVLYFGDLDPAGELISDVVNAHVSGWCKVPFNFVHCGLVPEQIARYNVPENFEKPGEYQWEALGDDAAREIISDAIAPYINRTALAAAEQMQDTETLRLRQVLRRVAGEWGGGALR
jgi:hypothetical protein